MLRELGALRGNKPSTVAASSSCRRVVVKAAEGRNPPKAA